jgi:hypothetical protein
LWTHILPCAIQLHRIMEHVRLYTQTISVLLPNNVNVILNNSLWKVFSFDKLHLWPNTGWECPTFNIFDCEEWLPITKHKNDIFHERSRNPNQKFWELNHLVVEYYWMVTKWRMSAVWSSSELSGCSFTHECLVMDVFTLQFAWFFFFAKLIFLILLFCHGNVSYLPSPLCQNA